MQVITPEEVSAAVLMKMKRTAEDYLGRPVKFAVVTVPGKTITECKTTRLVQLFEYC